MRKSVHSIFCEAFSEISKQNESVLDYPQEGLDPTVWEKAPNGVYVLTEAAKGPIHSLVKFIIEECKLKNPTARIVGSITSNTYSKDSDIDVHFSADNITEKNADEMNEKVRAAFKENWSDMHTDVTSIGTHKLEVYAQWNVNQDLMSVGAYDILNDEWLVGPELKNDDYDPYAEYYEKGIKSLGKLYGDIQSFILKAGEVAKVEFESSHSADKKFRGKIEKDVNQIVKDAAKMLGEIKESRSAASTPKSPEDASKTRDSEEWKTSDAAFKLLDKFGYLAILKDIADAGNHDEDSASAKAEYILAAIRDNLFGKKDDQ